MGQQPPNSAPELPFLSEYLVIQTLPCYNLTLLQHPGQIKHQFALKEFPFDSHTQAYDFSLKLEERCYQYKKCPYLVPLSKYLVAEEKHSVYAIFEYPHRTLDHERMDRAVKNLRFADSEIWSILVSCATALSHLEKLQVRHLNISSSTIGITDDGLIRIYDPKLLKSNPNYNLLLQNNRTCRNLYIAPQLCPHLLRKSKTPEGTDPYLSDVFVLGMVILEIGLMEYLTQCYSQDCSEFYPDILADKLKRFQQLYSLALTSVLRATLEEQHLRCSYRKLLRIIQKSEPKQSVYPLQTQSATVFPVLPHETPNRRSTRLLDGVTIVDSNIVFSKPPTNPVCYFDSQYRPNTFGVIMDPEAPDPSRLR